MAYIRTIVHYYLWEGGGQDEGRYFIIEDFINRGGGEGSNLLMNSSLNIPYFFFEVVPKIYYFCLQKNTKIKVILQNILSQLLVV